MKLICWLFGHRWYVANLSDWGTENVDEVYRCRRCGELEKVNFGEGE